MSKKYEFDVIIIGSGTAGIVCADTLLRNNLTVALIDENPHIGGQILRKLREPLKPLKRSRKDGFKRAAYNLMDSLKKSSVKLFTGSVMTAVHNGSVLSADIQGEGVCEFSYKFLLFACGARERFIPFKNWTLPGVISAGMCSTMIKSHGVLPAHNMVFAGSGMFLISAAADYIAAGGKLPGLFENAGMFDKYKLLPMLRSQLPKFIEGGEYMLKILSTLNMPLFKRRVVEARGSDCLEEVVIAKVDSKGRTKQGREKIIKTDGLALGFGFIPNVEGPSYAGCDLIFDENLGGWIVKTDANLRTSVSNVLAAGEMTGVGGSLKSMNEGELAGLSILEQLGTLSEEQIKRKKKLKRERKSHLKFAKLFNGLYKPDKALIESIPDETVICRCEDIRAKDIREAIKSGCRNTLSVKMETRAGMGSCQGRTCSSVISDMISIYSSDQCVPEPCSIRPPFKPVSVESYLK